MNLYCNKPIQNTTATIQNLNIDRLFSYGVRYEIIELNISQSKGCILFNIQIIYEYT